MMVGSLNVTGEYNFSQLSFGRPYRLQAISLNDIYTAIYAGNFSAKAGTFRPGGGGRFRSESCVPYSVTSLPSDPVAF